MPMRRAVPVVLSAGHRGDHDEPGQPRGLQRQPGGQQQPGADPAGERSGQRRGGPRQLLQPGHQRPG